jgi:hypothetical protein
MGVQKALSRFGSAILTRPRIGYLQNLQTCSDDLWAARAGRGDGAQVFHVVHVNHCC